LKSDLALARTWLGRTGTACPLKIQLGPSQYAAAHQVISTLTPHCTRWEDVTFDIPLSNFTDKLGVIKHRLPRLKSLVFDQAGRDLPFIDAFEVAPQLHNVELCSGISVSTLRIPWSQLTRCIVGARALDECFQVLELCSSLIDVVFFDSLEPGPDGSRQHLQLPNLQSIYFLFPISPLTSLFDYLTLPALVDFTFFEGPWDQLSFVSLLQRSDCHLQKLQFRTTHLYLDETDLETLLQLTPSLTVLNLSGASPIMATATLDRLTNRGLSDPRCLLPKLQTLRLSHYADFINGAFADMIESRWNLPDSYGQANIPQDRVVRLERCFLDVFGGTKGVDAAVRARLRHLRAEGLRIWPVGSEEGF
jgi:hypothetical protein